MSTLEQVQSGCSSCGNHLFKVSWSAGVPTAFDPEKDAPDYNPYHRKHKDKRTVPGNEDFGPDAEPGGGFGTTVRGRDDPRRNRNTSLYDEEYQRQIEKDIDGTEETNLDYKPDAGPKPHTFEDRDSSFLHDTLTKKPEPVGPHNMQDGLGYQFNKDLKRRRKSPFSSDSIFDSVSKKLRS